MHSSPRERERERDVAALLQLCCSSVAAPRRQRSQHVAFAFEICPHTTIHASSYFYIWGPNYVSSHCYICRSQHFHTLSAYYYICVLILGNLCEAFVPLLLYMRPRLRFRNLSADHYICVLMLLYMWPKTSKTHLSEVWATYTVV